MSGEMTTAVRPVSGAGTCAGAGSVDERVGSWEERVAMSEMRLETEETVQPVALAVRARAVRRKGVWREEYRVAEKGCVRGRRRTEVPPCMVACM
eukprot:350390-Chlamydomonas_euryale.AAC.3